MDDLDTLLASFHLNPLEMPEPMPLCQHRMVDGAPCGRISACVSAYCPLGDGLDPDH